MPSAVASFGFDLGTTNCALAACPLHPQGTPSSVLKIPQLVGSGSKADRPGLPSVLFWVDSEQNWVVGDWALRQWPEKPELAIQSAKSWITQAVQQADSIHLPPSSKFLPDSMRLTPHEAQSRILAQALEGIQLYLKKHFPGAQLENQSYAITVPASFSQAAQTATLEAAFSTGFPKDSTFLLEEPKAALVHYFESGEKDHQIEQGRILVVDIGGGTTDFSLFDQGEDGTVERIAVSSHILLGGDNIDLAVAHAMESLLLLENEEELPRSAWQQLLPQARKLKESALSDESPGELNFSVSLGHGSSLLESQRSAAVQGTDIAEMLIEGFFPLCSRNEFPHEGRSAIREWGLPYASDFAVTRYLARFLHPYPKIDAVLFNGGTMVPAVLRRRVISVLENWQASPVRELPNQRHSDAVALGAAAHAARLFHSNTRVRESTAFSTWLEISMDKTESTRWYCILPRRFPANQWATPDLPPIRAIVNSSVRFNAFEDNLSDARTGESILEPPSGTRRLPALHAELSSESAAAGARIPVTLKARQSETGLLEIQLLGRPPHADISSRLEFDLRGQRIQTSHGKQPSSGDLPSMEVPDMDFLIQGLSPIKRSGKAPSAASLLRQLANRCGSTPNDLPARILRPAADALLTAFPTIPAQPAAAAKLLQLLGFFLRPGWGYPGDSRRLQKLEHPDFTTMASPPRQVCIQKFILWRRIAFALEPSTQLTRLESVIPTVRRGNPPLHAEEILLAGSLLKIDLQIKLELVTSFIELASTEPARRKACLLALANLLHREPPFTPASWILPPDIVSSPLKQLMALDCPKAELVPVMIAAARRSQDPVHDLPDKDCRAVIRFLKKAGVAENRLTPLFEHVPTNPADAASSLGDPLPPGIVIEN